MKGLPLVFLRSRPSAAGMWSTPLAAPEGEQGNAAGVGGVRAGLRLAGVSVLVQPRPSPTPDAHSPHGGPYDPLARTAPPAGKPPSRSCLSPSPLSPAPNVHIRRVGWLKAWGRAGQPPKVSVRKPRLCAAALVHPCTPPAGHGMQVTGQVDVHASPTSALLPER